MHEKPVEEEIDGSSVIEILESLRHTSSTEQ
jgi:hypothetical protein